MKKQNDAPLVEETAPILEVGEEKVKELETRVEELANQLKRALADYQNMEKRAMTERQEWAKFANSGLISNLLPVLDTLERAAFYSKDPGVKMAVDQFRQALFNEKLEEINPNKGDAFDYTLHECVDSVESETDEEETICEVVSKGFRYQSGIILRAAKVKVFKKKNLPTQNGKNEVKSEEKKEGKENE